MPRLIFWQDEVKRPITKPNEPDMAPKHTKKAGLATYESEHG